MTGKRTRKKEKAQRGSSRCVLPGRIDESMRARGLNARQLAKKAGVPYSTLRSLGAARRGGHVETWEKLAAALGVPVAELRGRPDSAALAPQTFPLVGTAAASTGRTGRAFAEGEKLSLRGCFAVRVLDDSMEPVARHGQYVLASPARAVSSGDLVVVDLGEGGEGEWLFKRYVSDGRTHQFQSLNVQMEIPALVRRARPRRMHKVVAVVLE